MKKLNNKFILTTFPAANVVLHILSLFLLTSSSFMKSTQFLYSFSSNSNLESNTWIGGIVIAVLLIGFMFLCKKAVNTGKGIIIIIIISALLICGYLYFSHQYLTLNALSPYINVPISYILILIVEVVSYGFILYAAIKLYKEYK